MKTESETAEALSDFFLNILNNLNISRYSELDSAVGNITERTLRAILKYKDHPPYFQYKAYVKRKHVVLLRSTPKASKSKYSN